MFESWKHQSQLSLTKEQFSWLKIVRVKVSNGWVARLPNLAVKLQVFLGHFRIIIKWTWGFFPKICNLIPPSPQKKTNKKNKKNKKICNLTSLRLPPAHYPLQLGTKNFLKIAIISFIQFSLILLHCLAFHNSSFIFTIFNFVRYWSNIFIVLCPFLDAPLSHTYLYIGFSISVLFSLIFFLRISHFVARRSTFGHSWGSSPIRLIVINVFCWRFEPMARTFNGVGSLTSN